MIKAICSFLLFLMFFLPTYGEKVRYAVLVSANMEWKAVKKVFPEETYMPSPWGEYFYKDVSGHKVLFFHEGWGKVAAAGGTQYVIDHFKPEILINLGTCGGMEGACERFDIILADKTVIYDIKEAMGDSKEAIEDYTTSLDLKWLGEKFPYPVKRNLIVSGDRDLVPSEIVKLKEEYEAIAGDWETGAIAYVAKRNKVKLVILRGVSDVVSSQEGEAYGNFDLFVQRAEQVMRLLLKQLPGWITYIESLEK